MNAYSQKQLQAFNKIEESFKKEEWISTLVEPVSDYVNDNRIGLTSVAFVPNNLVQKIIKQLIEPLKKVNPTQYFYIPDSFHNTINNIRTAAETPLFNNEDIKKVREVFERIVPRHKSFSFELKRLFELPTSLAICTFSDKTLADLVLELRTELKKIGVPDNKSYFVEDIIVGNTTISRFTSIPNATFKEKVKELKEIEIGSFEVKKIFLITTNSVCHPLKTTVIDEYSLA